MKKNILNIGKICLSILTVPLWFIKFFVGIGHMPNVDTGKIEEVRFYHSMFENINDLDLGFLFYISIALVIATVVTSAINIKNNDKRINTLSNVVAVITIISFIVFLVIASTVARGY